LNKGNINVSRIDQDTSYSMFLSYLASQENNNEYLWLLDNGCSNHIIGNKDVFSRFDEIVKYQIKLGHYQLVHALGKR